MPSSCFSYPADGLAGSEDRDVVRPNLRDPRRMPHIYFSYPADVPPVPSRHDAEEPVQPSQRSRCPAPASGTDPVLQTVRES